MSYHTTSVIIHRSIYWKNIYFHSYFLPTVTVYSFEQNGTVIADISVCSIIIPIKLGSINRKMFIIATKRMNETFIIRAGHGYINIIIPRYISFMAHRTYSCTTIQKIFNPIFSAKLIYLNNDVKLNLFYFIYTNFSHIL